MEPKKTATKPLREQLYGTPTPLRDKLAVLREQNGAKNITKEATKPIAPKS